VTAAADAPTEPIPRVTSAVEQAAAERSTGERRARRRRLLGDVATYTALSIATFVAFCVAGLAWIDEWSVARDPGATLFYEYVRTVSDSEWTWEWGLPTFRAEGVTYDGTLLVGTSTASPWIYAPLVVGLVWWVVVSARLRRPPIGADRTTDGTAAAGSPDPEVTQPLPRSG
jgi:hypothetical protein